jgi:hypothetical protein
MFKAQQHRNKREERDMVVSAFVRARRNIPGGGVDRSHDSTTRQRYTSPVIDIILLYMPYYERRRSLPYYKKRFAHSFPRRLNSPAGIEIRAFQPPQKFRCPLHPTSPIATRKQCPALIGPNNVPGIQNPPDDVQASEAFKLRASAR